MNEYDRRQIRQAIDYLEFKAGRKLNVVEIFTAIYLADRHHLRMYASPVIGGTSMKRPTYWAVDESLPPINSWVAEYFGLDVEKDSREQFLIKCDLLTS